jgi:nicotinamidase-related amidase
MQRSRGARLLQIGSHLAAAKASRPGDAELRHLISVELTRRDKPTSDGSAQPVRQTVEHWVPHQTAVIVCDMWNLHHCLNATRRGIELCPTMERMLTALRANGVTVIHAPSGCMRTYAETAARRRAQDAPAAAVLPEGIDEWQHTSAGEPPTTGTHEGEQGAEADGCVPGGYPIDQRASEEDDDPTEHAAWARQLIAAGQRADAPWTRQTSALTIDQRVDFISDSGSEIWNVLTARGLTNVLMCGVHTNMCVLGRPFGLRQLARLGIKVASHGP